MRAVACNCLVSRAPIVNASSNLTDESGAPIDWFPGQTDRHNLLASGLLRVGSCVAIVSSKYYFDGSPGLQLRAKCQATT